MVKALKNQSLLCGFTRHPLFFFNLIHMFLLWPPFLGWAEPANRLRRSHFQLNGLKNSTLSEHEQNRSRYGESSLSGHNAPMTVARRFVLWKPRKS